MVGLLNQVSADIGSTDDNHAPCGRAVATALALLLSASTVATSVGAGLVGCETPLTGGTLRTLAQKVSDFISVKDFGAQGTGGDDTAAIQAALSAGVNANVYVPAGLYGISRNLVIPAGCRLIFESNTDQDAQFAAIGTFNNDMFTIQNTCSIINGVAIGNATTSTPLQILINISGASNVEIIGGRYENGYTNINYSGTSFYATFQNIVVGSAVNRQFNGAGSGASGNDFDMAMCLFQNTNVNMQDSIYLDTLGSFTMTAVRCTPVIANHSTICINSLATAAGVCQGANCVFENGTTGVPACLYVGTSGAPIKNISFTNSDFNSSATAIGDNAVTLDYAQDCRFIACEISGFYGVHTVNATKRIDVSHSHFDGSNECITAETTATTVGIIANECVWLGAFSFMDFSNLSYTTYDYIEVRGGYLGTNATPINLNNPTLANAWIETSGYNHGPYHTQPYTGNLTAGAVTIAHGIQNGPKRILSYACHANDGAGNGTPMTCTAITPTTITFTGGLLTNTYIASITYASSDLPY